MKPEIALEIATVNTIEKYQAKTGISTKALANEIGISRKQVFLNKLCITNTDNHFAAKHYFAIQRLTGDKTIGEVFLWVSEQCIACHELSTQEVADVLLTLPIDSGEVIKVVRDAIADGEVNQNELKKTLSAIGKAQQGLKELESLLINGSRQVRRVA